MEDIVQGILSGLSNGSPYRPFGFPKKNLSSFVCSKDFRCPNCGEEPPEYDDLYEVDGHQYPELYNEYLLSTDDGTIHDWDEVHCCPKCKTKFWFRNGCF